MNNAQARLFLRTFPWPSGVRPPCDVAFHFAFSGLDAGFECGCYLGRFPLVIRASAPSPERALQGAIIAYIEQHHTPLRPAAELSLRRLAN